MMMMMCGVTTKVLELLHGYSARVSVQELQAASKHMWSWVVRACDGRIKKKGRGKDNEGGVRTPRGTHPAPEAQTRSCALCACHGSYYDSEASRARSHAGGTQVQRQGRQYRQQR